MMCVYLKDNFGVSDHLMGGSDPVGLHIGEGGGRWIGEETAAKSLQSCPTLCDPVDGSPPGSPVPGILQARTPEWVAISLSNAWKWKVKVKSLGHVRLLATPWTAAYQAPPSMGFSRQEYWSGLPLPSLGEETTLIYIFSNKGVQVAVLWDICNVIWLQYIINVCTHRGLKGTPSHFCKRHFHLFMGWSPVSHWHCSLLSISDGKSPNRIFEVADDAEIEQGSCPANQWNSSCLWIVRLFMLASFLVFKGS